jgi:dTDP-4-amino-4,6-dideoxygalactose transaminase
MVDLQAALALPQLAHIENWQRRRETYTVLYNQGIADIDGLLPLQVKPNPRSAYYL